MTKFEKQESLAIILAIFGLVIIAIGILLKWWDLSTVLNYVPEIIIVSIVAVLLWGFRKRIGRVFKSTSEKHHSEASTNTSVTGITKILGTPDSIEKGIQNYKSRTRIPLDILLSEATKRVDMLAITFHEITTANIKLIEEAIYRNVRITFTILRANSQYAQNREDDFHEGEEIPHHIERSLHILCDLKRRVGSNYSDNLIIKTYSASIDNSIIIIDNNLIKIENHVKRSDPNSRPNRLAYRVDNEAFFEQYMNEFNAIRTEIYDC
jgi:hypothetical protein